MSKEHLIDLEPDQLGLLEQILKRHIPNKTVWAYGSRVTWKADERSDLDLAVFDCDLTETGALKEALEESNLLVSVDVMNWESIPENFKENIREKYVVLQEKTKLEGWRDVKFSDFCEITRGGSPRPIHDYIVPSGTPWVKIADATKTNSRYIFDTKEFIKPEGESKSKVVYPGDFIVSNSATPGLPRFMKIRACIHDGWLLLREIKDIDKVFLYYLILVERESILLKGSGTIFTNLKTDILKNHIISIPPLSEQKAIAEILSSLDDKIDLLHRQNKTLEDMAQTLFRKWFVEDADEGWEEVNLGDFFPIVTGKKDANYSTNNGRYPFFTCAQSILQAPDYSFKGKAILLAGNGYFNVKRYEGKFEAYQRTYVLIPNEDKYFGFLYTLIKFYLAEIISGAQGSVIHFITKSMISDFRFSIPKVNFDDKLKQINEIYVEVDSNQSQIHTLENLRDTLLPKLMNGKARISK